MRPGVQKLEETHTAHLQRHTVLSHLICRNGEGVLRGKGKSREKGSVFSQATAVPQRDGRPSLARGRPTDKANQPGGCSCQSDTLEGVGLAST